MSFTLNNINGVETVEVFEDGGHELIIYGTFEKGKIYNVYIGDYKNSSDAICYSGIPEQGNNIYSEVNDTLYVYTPMLIPTNGNPYSLTVIDSVTLVVKVLLDTIYVRKKQFYNKVYFIRKNLNPKYLRGPISIKEEN